MTERLRKIESLFHAALELDEASRAAFLDNACGGEVDLRREVDSLLSYSKLSENFIETPALAIIAKELASKQRQELARCRDDARRKKKR